MAPVRIIGRGTPTEPLPTDGIAAPDTKVVAGGADALSDAAREDYAKLFAWTRSTPSATAVDESIRFRAQMMPVHASWSKTSVSDAVQDGQLDLNLVSADMLKALSPSQLKTLTGLLARTEVISEIHNPRGGKMSQVEVRARQLLRQPRKINGATALVVKGIRSGDTELIGRLVSAAPEHALPVLKLKGEAQALVRGDSIVRILHEMRTSGFGDEPREIKPDELDSLGTLIKLSLEAARDRDDIDLAESVQMLFYEFHDARIDLSPENTGILAGATVAGLAKVDEKHNVRQTQAKRVTNHVWAASWLAGPFAGIASSIVVGLGDAYASFKDQELTEMARHRRNRLEAHWLQHPPPDWTFDDCTRAMQWVDLTIRSNRVHV